MPATAGQIGIDEPFSRMKYAEVVQKLYVASLKAKSQRHLGRDSIQHIECQKLFI